MIYPCLFGVPPGRWCWDYERSLFFGRGRYCVSVFIFNFTSPNNGSMDFGNGPHTNSKCFHLVTFASF